jgi:hypothetical protein
MNNMRQYIEVENNSNILTERRGYRKFKDESNIICFLDTRDQSISFYIENGRSLIEELIDGEVKLYDSCNSLIKHVVLDCSLPIIEYV